MKLPPLLSLPLFELSPHSSTALYQQIFQELERRILAGQLRAGTKLPSSRELAKALGIARSTTLRAYEQLGAEGYLSAKVGDGTRVSNCLPEKYLQSSSATTEARSSRSQRQIQRGALLTRAQAIPAGAWRSWHEIRPLRTGTPPFDIFPFKLWARLLYEAQRDARSTQLGYGSGMGYLPLRQAIARHLAPARGITCSAEDVVVLTSSQHAIDLVIRSLCRSGDSAYCESPGYPGARYLLQLAGVRSLGLPIDQYGLRIPKRAKKAALLFSTPSHQFPTGVTMSLRRRLELLEWSQSNGIPIIEDDYSGEYRFHERPLPALKALDTKGLVFYIGTFSKAAFPALRIGYLVLPAHYRSEFEHLLSLLESAVSTPVQIALARFIDQGHYARHLRKVRKLAYQRKQVLIETLTQQLPSGCSYHDSDAGMHLLLRLPKRLDDSLISAKLERQGIQVLALSECYGSPKPKAAFPGLILHYAGFKERAIREAAMQLCTLLRRALA
jgi:GntR family transcriptional regulator/MocR family aminotransferase